MVKNEQEKILQNLANLIDAALANNPVALKRRDDRMKRRQLRERLASQEGQQTSPQRNDQRRPI